MPNDDTERIHDRTSRSGLHTTVSMSFSARRQRAPSGLLARTPSRGWMNECDGWPGGRRNRRWPTMAGGFGLAAVPRLGHVRCPHLLLSDVSQRRAGAFTQT